MNIPDATAIGHRYITGILNQDKRFESKKNAWICVSEVDGNDFCSWLNIIGSKFWKPVSEPTYKLNESLMIIQLTICLIISGRVNHLFLCSGILKRPTQMFMIMINLNIHRRKHLFSSFSTNNVLIVQKIKDFSLEQLDLRLENRHWSLYVVDYADTSPYNNGSCPSDYKQP